MLKSVIIIFTISFSLILSANVNKKCSKEIVQKAKDKILYLITPDENDFCIQDFDFDDLFFIDKVKDIEYLVMFLANHCQLGNFNNYKKVNDLLASGVAKDAEDVDIIICNKIIDTVQKDMIGLNIFVDRPLQIEYDPLNGEARTISWQHMGFRHLLHLQNLTLHNRYEIWKKGDISILPNRHYASVKRTRRGYFLGKIIREMETGRFKCSDDQKKIIFKNLLFN